MTSRNWIYLIFTVSVVGVLVVSINHNAPPRDALTDKEKVDLCEQSIVEFIRKEPGGPWYAWQFPRWGVAKKLSDGYAVPVELGVVDDHHTSEQARFHLTCTLTPNPGFGMHATITRE